MKGILSLRGFRKLRTGAIVATGVFLFATSNVQVVQASEEDGVWEARTVEQVKADIASLAKDSNYVIKWGDTLSVISEATGISMDALAQMNQITNVNLIYAHNELGFTQPISTTTGNQTVSKQTVTVVNRQNKKEEVKAFEVTTKEDTQSGKTETVVTEVKPTTKEEKTVSKTDQVSVVTTKEEASKVNQTLVSSQPAEKAATISKAETAKVDQTSTTGKVEAKKADQAPAVEKPVETPVATETKESIPSNPVEEKKQTEEIAAKKATEGTASKESPTSAAESEGKVENSAPATNVEESTTVEKQTEINKDQEPATVVNPAETPVATEAKESTPSNSVEEKKQTEGTTPKETTEEKVDNKEVTSSTDKTSKENPTSEEVPTSSTPSAGSEGKVESSAPTTTEKESTTVEKKTETNADQASAAVVKPTTNTPSKDSVENNEIAPSTNNSSNEGEKHETVVPKEVTQENKDALDSHKQIKLKEINESSLTPEQKEQAITKVKELTTKAEKAIEGAATSEEQANVVDQYEKDLIAIATPNVETPKPDFTKPIESHNPTGSTTIGEGGAISTLASSTPAVSESAANTPVVSTPSTASAPAASTPATSEPTASASAESIPATSTPVESVPEASTPALSKPTSTEAASSPSTTTNRSVSDTSASNTSPEYTAFRNAPAYQPRVVRRARSVDAPKNQVAIYYNFAEMKDIAGFLGDPGESIITVPAGASSDEIRTIVKAKIDAKKAELAKRGYTFMEDYFVDKPQEDTIRYDYVVNFTKAASASEQATSTATPSTPVVSESAAPSVPVTNETAASTPAESTPTTSVPAPSVPAPSVPATSVPATSVPTASTLAPSTPTSTEAASSPSTTTNRSVSDTSASNTNSENTGFRNAPAYQPRVVRRARSVDAPKDQVAIYYNFAEMKDIAGFLGDPGESIITVPAGASSDEIRTIVKAKIDAKKAELAKRGYTFMEDYFVDKPQEDTIRYDYVVNFTKAASLRVAPVSQPRAARNRRSVVESPVKTRKITFYYQLAGLEIAGALGTPGKNYVITVPETASTTEIQQAIDDATRSEKAELGRFFKYVRETNLQTDILDRGFGNFDYVITFTR